MKLAFSHCFELFSTVCVTFFPRSVETVNDDVQMASLTFYRFGRQVLVGHG